MTEASEITYNNINNKQRRKSHRQLIIDFCEQNKSNHWNAIELSRRIPEFNGNMTNILKRVSDLTKEGRLLDSGTNSKINGSTYTSYWYVSQEDAIPLPTENEVWHKSIKSIVNLNVYNKIIAEKEAISNNKK